MRKNILLGAAAAALFGGQLLAVPIAYEPDDLDTIPFGTGSVEGTGGHSCGICGQGGPGTTDWWKFSGTAGQSVTLTGARIDEDLDLAFAVYLGTLAPGTDDNVRVGKYIFADGSPLGLTLLGIGDDEIGHPGPYGDPQLSLILPSTGQYTVAVSAGIGSGFGPSSAYQITLGPGLDVVDSPEPSTYVMLGTGLAGLILAARRKKSV